MQLTWDTVLSVLRDPLFALGSSVVLALLASRVLQGFFRFCVLAGIASVAIEPLLPRSVRRTAGGRMAEA